MFTRHLIPIFMCGLLMGPSAVAKAQQDASEEVPEAAPTEEELQQGRDLFSQGTEQASLANWDAARSLFQDAYDLARAPIILYNLGNAQRNTGMLMEALESYRRFLTEADQERWSDEIEEMRGLMNELLEDIPRITIAATAMREGDTLRLDGEDVGAADTTSAIQLNPGEHRVTVVRDGEEVETIRFTLSARDRNAVAIEAPAPPRAALPPEAEEGSNTGLWIGVGVGAAVAIGATVAIILLTGSSQYTGNFGSGQVEVP